MSGMVTAQGVTEYNIMKIFKIVSAIVLIITVVVSIYFFTQKRNKDAIKAEVTAASDVLFSPYTKTEERIAAVRSLKTLSLDGTKTNEVRVSAGQAVVSNFFEFGMTLGAGFSDKAFTERDIFEYAKSISALGDSDRNSLNTAYIGLRFYPEEMTKEYVTELLQSYKRYVAVNGDHNLCNGSSKFSSVLYLAQKNKHTDVSAEFGNYYPSFENTFNNICIGRGKIFAGFMWLAAISDVGTTDAEKKQAEELVTFVTQDKSENAPMVKYMRNAYLGDNKEPDTVSIVDRLIAKYPEFKAFVSGIK